MSAVGGTLLAFLAALPIWLVGAVLSGTVGWHLLLLPVVLLLELALILAVGLLASALHPAFRDVKYLVESGLLVGFYATPVLYDPSQLTGTLPALLPFNPMTGVLSLYRAAVLGRPVDGLALAVTLVVTVLLGSLAVVVFRRRCDEFADLV
jgi:ABC-2 type transport system permease protein